MKVSRIKYSLAAALLLSTFNFQLSTAFAQGSLTPPGAPAPTMKSLDQVQPRTPISSAPFTITNSGSYYLTTNLTVSSGDAIDINVNGVTLDLNGFTISSTAPSATVLAYAILLNNGPSDVTISNGHILSEVTNNGSGVYSGSGFKNGIGGSPGNNTRVSGVSVTGCYADGINLGEMNSTVVDSCTVQTAGKNGIVASTVKSSVAVGCGLTGINGREVSDSRGENTGSGPGSFGINAYTAQNCYGYSSGNGCAISATTAQNCYGTSVSGPGINATTAQNCYGYSTSGTGLNVSSIAIGCVGGSTSGTGLSANIANSCLGGSTSGTAQNITYKYNMP